VLRSRPGQHRRLPWSLPRTEASQFLKKYI
jgi:hypothetical protein